MTGATRYYEAQQEMKQYLANNDIYSGHEPLEFDLRGYSAYVHEHELSASDITTEIWEMFSKR